MGKSSAPMEDQVAPSQPPEFLPITREQLDEMKSRARELAIQQTLAQQGAMPQPQPQVIYVRRNFTVAELLLIIVVSCGIVTGIQWTWNVITDILPRIEIRAK